MINQVDHIFLANTIHTMRDTPTAVTAIGVTRGRIVAIGTRVDAERWKGPRTAVTDFGDATLTPGLIDSHSHPIAGLRMTLGPDLSVAKTLPEIARLISGETSAAADGAWVVGWGLLPDAAGEEGLHRNFLDSVTAGHPAAIRAFDGHSMLVNSAALARAGIDGPRTFDQHATIECDADGVPTGRLIEPPAIDLIEKILPEPPIEVLAESLVELLRRMAATGLTSLHAMDFMREPIELLEAAERVGPLPLRLRFSPWCSPGDSREDWERVAALQGCGGSRWVVNGVKFFMDGTIDNGTAWLDAPDYYGESTRSYWPDLDEFARAIAFFAERGISTSTHSTGDAGVANVLQTLEALGDVHDLAPHRIEHIETAPDELLPKFAELGVAASMQPTHGTHYLRADQTDNWSVRVGPERLEHAWRTRDLRDAGAVVALGSDWPIAPFDPREIMADAQLRRPAGHPEDAPIGARQGLTARMALEGYTSHAAEADRLQGALGTIEIGAYADFTVFAADPLLLSPDDLAVCPIVATIVDGDDVNDGRGRSER